MPGSDQNHYDTPTQRPLRLIEASVDPRSRIFPANFENFRRVSHRSRCNFGINTKDQQNLKVEFSSVVTGKFETKILTDGDSKVVQNGAQNECHCADVNKSDDKVSGHDTRKSSSQSDADKQLALVSFKLNSLSLRSTRIDRRESSTSTSTWSSLEPSNFRDLSLFPTMNDLSARYVLSCVEPNLTEGAYRDVEHYLNVQFRLLREDFIASVRKGVQQYRQQASDKSRYDGIRIYPQTRFERVQSTKNNKLGILVNFDPDAKMKNFRWKESKRFMYGSLLLFTIDDFRTTFFFCTVVERDMDALKAGKVLVSLTDKARTDRSFFRRAYLMAECEAFFDPYFLVMKLWRDFDERTFPMKRYIVQGAVEPQFPKYVRDFGVLKVHDRVLAPVTVHGDSWPTAEELRLDRYQYEAFKAALTRDLCVIQGPPGTGKTFIGLKIVQNIWQNANSFNFKLRLPILVVCSANHAVDQFLEGVLQFTTNIVRVGGQSRSELMKKYNLRERTRAENRFVSTKGLSVAIKSCQREVDRVGVLMKCAKNPTGILKGRMLEDVVQPQFQSLMRSDSDLIRWLQIDRGINKSYDRSDFEIFKFECGNKKEKPVRKIVELDEDDEYDDEDEISEPEIISYRMMDEENFYSISVLELRKKCQACIEKFFRMKNNDEKSSNVDQDPKTFCDKMNLCKEECQRYLRQLRGLEKRLSRPIFNENYIAEHNLAAKKADQLDVDERWFMYWDWTAKLQVSLAKELEELERLHCENMKQYDECRLQQDLEVMQKADVVGMTTSGAARLNELLKSLQPAVVVIEEAGEVLETHVVASLTNKCQHVILIGDHEQLRPITAMYELSRDYNMNVSLFERLVKNGMDCPVLNVQHRMRPEISCLISPLIYPDLKNHESVRHFESIKGVEKNVFFVNHNVFEKTTNDSSSKQNEYEARFVIRLANYLIQQQYDPEKITILTTYTAQRILIRNLQRDLLDRPVKCVVVDKYQGEENDIVLLSLVRSNAHGNIGFLSTKNRVCVALSRAKKGFYIVGNMDCLSKRGALWQNIRQTLTINEAIGEALPLYCSIHNKLTLVSTIDDFYHVRCGGCDNKCNVRMKCGHICSSLCHYTSGEHPPTKCLKEVSKLIQSCGHRVILQCWMEPIIENCDKCRVDSPAKKGGSAVTQNQKNGYRNRRGVVLVRSSAGYTPTIPKYSYSLAPSPCLADRRSLFSGCRLL